MHDVEETKPNLLADRLEASIRSGMERGRREQLRQRRSRIRRLVATSAATLLVLSCLLTLRVSPVFAAMIRDIPGMSGFVDLISHSYDRGITLAADHDYIQLVGVTDTHDGVALTVAGILADESRLVIFYEAHSTVKNEKLRIGWPELTDSQGKALEAGTSSGSPSELKEHGKWTGIYQSTIDVQMGEGIQLPDVVTLRLQMGADPNPAVETPNGAIYSEGMPRPVKESDPEFVIQIPIDHARFQGLKQTYPIQQQIALEGQTIGFDKYLISPLRIALYVHFDERNLQQIFGFGDLHLVDGEGNEWKQNMGSLGVNQQVLYFESTYFHEPKELYLAGSWLRAMEKTKMKLVVDTEQQKIIQQPDSKVKLKEVARTPGYTKLTFTLDDLRKDDHVGYALLGWDGFTDGSGNHYKFKEYRPEETVGLSTRRGADQQVQQELYYYLDNQDYVQPLTFDIYDYPSYLEQNFKVRIK